MTETGWPLIPREVLPPPVPVAKRASRRHASGAAVGRQLSMFGAETTEPSPADLAGLLAGPGRLGRMGGTARVTVRVDAAWRVHVLVAELVARGLTATWAPAAEDPELQPAAAEDPELQPAAAEDPELQPAAAEDPEPQPATAQDPDSQEPETENPDGVRDDELPAAAETVDETQLTAPPHFDVRTAYSQRLNSLARAWPAAAAELFLSGPRLRLWVAAAGGPHPGGYALGLDPAKDRRPVEAALVRVGLAGRVSDDGRLYVITGRRRLRRLAELVGERPAAAPEEAWPGGAAA